MALAWPDRPPVLTGHDLVLRAPASRDVDVIHRACQDPAIQRFTRVPVPYALADAEMFVGTLAPLGWNERIAASFLAVDHADAVLGPDADASDGADYLYTLLVPADANQLFPCFDQPDLKAKVRLTLESPIAWTVIANGSVVQSKVDEMPRTISAPIRLSFAAKPTGAGPGPRFGEHTDQVLGELGYSAADIKRLREAKAVA